MIRWILLAAALVAAAGVAAWIALAPKTPPDVYAVVAFGDEKANRIGFVARGADLYLDRDPDDGIQRKEYLGADKCKLPFQIRTTDGTTFDNVSVSLRLAADVVSELRRQKLIVDVDVSDVVTFSQAGHVEMADSADEAATLQVDGELTLQVSESSLPESLEAGGASANIRARVITVHADRRAGISLYSKSLRDGTADAAIGIVAPDMDVEFPAANSMDAPLGERIALDQFC